MNREAHAAPTAGYTDGPKAATEAELRDLCDHVCLHRVNHEGPHFYGYLLGPHSRAGLQREVDRLRGLLISHGVDPDGCMACFLAATEAGPPCPSANDSKAPPRP